MTFSPIRILIQGILLLQLFALRIILHTLSRLFRIVVITFKTDIGSISGSKFEITVRHDNGLVLIARIIGLIIPFRTLFPLPFILTFT
ncbi:membrane protein [gut metagenome]|uniref:Membrane protein n=1 Tax=gut metagenome TaxID=749906 RepID=J9GRJ3_9ZZZZ